jgi:lysophospholipid acyltransferase (LPLAT)-like uncharacterized protein
MLPNRLPESDLPRSSPKADGRLTADAVEKVGLEDVVKS